MNAYKNFIFKDYNFDPGSKILRLYYSFDGILEFSESYKFDFDFVEYDPITLDKALQSLFFMAGISYYKAYIPKSIVIDRGAMDDVEAKFFSKTYQKGLGEFFYVNQLDPNTPINFPVSATTAIETKLPSTGSLLVGIGGGKDSLVSVELLRDSGLDITTWSLSHRSQLEPLIKVIGLPHLWVERTWDRSLLEHNAANALNGHIPISAILACAGTIVAILSGREQVVVSNENSANEPDLEYRGVQINHQYSKSLEFEEDYQAYLKHTIGAPGYFSYLRPLSEIYIAEIFARVGFSKYLGVFSSCNRAFTHESQHIFWCGKCAKCAFTYLALTPFVEANELESIWGKNLLLDPELEVTYKKLLGILDKPLDCVGEIKESRMAMRLAQETYPELNKYKFDIPSDYNYQSFSKSSMPEKILAQLENQIAKINN
jgi:hypothetical protein